MTTHESCTHEKTKAARAACRRGASTTTDSRPETAAERLRAKAGASTAGKACKRPDSDEGEPIKRRRTSDRHARLFQSGHCDAGRHTVCTGQYTLTPCSCPCHTTDA